MNKNFFTEVIDGVTYLFRIFIDEDGQEQVVAQNEIRKVSDKLRKVRSKTAKGALINKMFNEGYYICDLSMLVHATDRMLIKYFTA